MANRTKFWHFNTSGGFYGELLSNTGLTDTPENRAQALVSTDNGCYHYIVFIKETDQIYTHGNLYDCSTFNGADINKLLGEIVSTDILEDNSPKDIVAKMLYIINSNSKEIIKLKNEKVDRSEISNFATIDDVRNMIKEAVDWYNGCWDDSGNLDPEEPDTEDAIGSIGANKMISIDESMLTSGTYTLRYIDENDSIIDSFKPITSFTI